MSIRKQVYEAVAKSLREFGYPDTTGAMIKETHDAMLEGKTGADLPHGVVSRFAEDQLKDAFDRLGGE